MAAYPVNTPGNGVGVSGLAQATAQPRPRPMQRAAVAESGPSPQQLHTAWQAYNGVLDPDNTGPLSSQPNVPNLNVLSNRMRPIVNTGVDFLFGPPLTITVEGEESAGAQQLLDAVWGDDDQRMTLLSKAAINGGIYGHVFMKVVPPKKGTPSVDNPPRLVLLNPETLSVETDPDDADLVMRYCIEYACLDPDTRAPMRKRQTVTRVDPDGDDDTTATTMDSDTTWEIADFVSYSQMGDNWQPVGEPQTWDYELPPIIDWQNYPNPNEHWGQRDVTDSLVALNKQLRLVESNINKIGFLQGHPYLYSVGTNTGGIRPTPGMIIDLEGIEAKIAAVDASGDLAQLMAFADQIRSDMDEESGIPAVATGRLKDLPRGAISGITMRLLHASALARTEHKRRLYGQGIRQVCQTILVLGGMAMDTVRALEIKLTWQDPLPSDDLAEAQAWQTKLQLGYSQTTAIEETGGNPELEQDRKADEQQQQMLAFSQGQGMPPMDDQALKESADLSGPDGDEDETSVSAAGDKNGSAGNDAQVSNKSANGKKSRQQQRQRMQQLAQHPKAQQAQKIAGMAMKAAYGKAPNA